MSTNFYWRTNPIVSCAMQTLPTGEVVSWDEPQDGPRIHIGKRSAAGMYCWDCDETLHKEGRERIHYGVPAKYWPGGNVNVPDLRAMVAAMGNAMYKCCPKCGQAPVKPESLDEGAAAIELGFAKPRAVRPTGVRGTSSFSWAQDPERVGAICEQNPTAQLIEDEYGSVFTGLEFLDMLRANCAIQYTDSIGIEFC